MPVGRGAVDHRHALAQLARGLERRVDLGELGARGLLRLGKVHEHGVADVRGRGARKLGRRIGQLRQIERELLEREIDDLGIGATRHRARDRRREHERGDLVGRQPDLGHLEALEIDDVAAVLERVVLVGRDVADRHAEIEEIGLVALERAQPGLDVERLVRGELLADVAIGDRRARAQEDHHEIEQALAAIAARAGVVELRGLRGARLGQLARLRARLLRLHLGLRRHDTISSRCGSKVIPDADAARSARIPRRDGRSRTRPRPRPRGTRRSARCS